MIDYSIRNIENLFILINSHPRVGAVTEGLKCLY